MPSYCTFLRSWLSRPCMKILQLVIAIIAFATTAAYYSEFQINVTIQCHATKTATHKEVIKFGFPFSQEDLYSDGDICPHPSTHKHHKLDSNFKSESEFFVFVGVVSFLYSIIALVRYVCYEDSKVFSVVDFFVTLLLALFWFCAAIAWAVGLASLKNKTDATDYIKNADECHWPNSCSVLKKAGYASLIVSVLSGFLNCFLWCANICVACKESRKHLCCVQMDTADPDSE